MTKIAVIRFSALGDVAMLVPVVSRTASANPDVQFTIISRQQTKALWSGLPANVVFMGADLKGSHHGIKGLNRLLAEIDYRSFDAVADMHSVLRTWYMDFRWLLAGIPVSRIDKGRRAKRWLTCSLNRKKHQLTPTVERYADVFRALHLRLPSPLIEPTHSASPLVKSGVGIAPFAAQRSKIYPLDKMEQVVAQISRTETVYLFGGGEEEVSLLHDWAERHDNVVCVAGAHTMLEELEIIRGIRVMVTMDSANMHLASLVGTRVISIWGATDPKAGFLGYGQSVADCVCRDLPCRPCSVFGSRPCRYNDYRCLNIPPETIIARING